MTNPADKVKEWVTRSRQFYTDVRSEMKKVSWPGMREVRDTTAVVIIAVFFFGLYLGLVDYLLAMGLNRILSYFTSTGG